MRHVAFFLTRDTHDRRSYPRAAGMAAAVAWLFISVAGATDFHVAMSGDDANPGSADHPFATLQRAQRALRQAGSPGPKTVYLHEGTHYLLRTLVLTAEDSGAAEAPVTFAAAAGENVVLSGGVRLDLHWEPFRGDVMKTVVPPGLVTDQLFVNGQRQHMARYPNVDPSVRHFNGFAPDAFSPARAARWADPRGGFIHAMHRHEWGDFHYVITGKHETGAVTYEGGWQNNRRLGMHDRYRFVENIFEELDAPGEWFHDAKTNTLYFYPPAGLNLEDAVVEAVRLKHLIEFRGTRGRPVRFIQLRGLTFRHAARTFMENREPLLRSDWTTYRGGAVLCDGAEDCAIEDCTLDQVGGNAIFVNNYNRRVAVRGCHIVGAGANGVAFVGDPNAVRSPLFEYRQRQSYEQIDKTPGPKTDNYPADCVVEDCLIHETGRVEKQTAPVQISMSMGITVRHCSVYDVPRAGINVSEGTFGGHLIEFCDVFDTVLETGDHGSFNSWGRDRYWGLKDIDLNTVTLGEDRDLPLLDIVKPNILRNNRWRCDHGWDIDLDDGSSRYEIYNNLCLNGGLKLREGFYRLVENNVIVNNSFHPHVWYGNSEDVFRRNIVFTAYKPIRANKPWGRQCDHNLLHKPGLLHPAAAVSLQQQSGLDANSIEADAMFVDPARGDYRVKAQSPAVRLGFRNFPMDRFGVQKPALRAIARAPQLPEPRKGPPLSGNRDGRVVNWLGARIRNVMGLGEVSANGLPGETGVMILDAPVESEATRGGLRQGDVILRCGDRQIDTLDEFLQVWHSIQPGSHVRLEIFRDQQRISVEVSAGPIASGPGPAAPKPLYRDPVHDGAADPVVIWNRAQKRWFMFYTNRRANLANPVGVDWVHGTRIGIAESTDGGATWMYRRTARIDHGREDYSHWAPEVIEHQGCYHMFLTIVPGTFTDWNAPRDIVHLTSSDLLDWRCESTLKLASDRVIDACVLRLQDGTWRMWYNNERDRKSIYYADSSDLFHWTDRGKAIGDRPGEGPKVFRWQGWYWMIVDNWQGLGVYRSEDTLTWRRQPDNLLEQPGKGEDDRVKGGHPDVVVSGSRAFLFYFTHPGRRGADEKRDGYEQRRSSIQVVELKLRDGWVACDRDAPAYIRLQPPDDVHETSKGGTENDEEKRGP